MDHPLWRWLCLIIFLGTGAAVLFVGPDAAWEKPPSDAMEYATCAHRLVTDGTYGVVLNGKAHPSRYPPGFPVFFLAPVYWISDSHLGYGVFPVFAAAMAVLGILWYLCRRSLPGQWGGIAAASCTFALLMKTPYFEAQSRKIMSDIPIIALSMISLLIYHRAWKQSKAGDFLLAGMLIALLLWIRITCLSLCFPFAFLLLRAFPKVEWKKALALAGPVALGVGGLLYYNRATFGDPFFTGYHYWLAPRAYELDFSHFWPNLIALVNPFFRITSPPLILQDWIGPAFMAGALVCFLLCRKRRPELWARIAYILHFMLMVTLPVFLFHLFYPFHSVRFVLLLHILLFLLGSICFCGLFHRISPKILAPVALLLILAAGVGAFPYRIRPGFSRLDVMRAADRILPDDACFISNNNGIYVEAMVIKDTSRKYIPLQTSTQIFKWRCIGYPGQDPIRAFEFAALEEPEKVSALLQAGKRVFINVPARFEATEAWDRFTKRFTLKKLWRVHANGPWIAEVT